MMFSRKRILTLASVVMLSALIFTEVQAKGGSMIEHVVFLKLKPEVSEAQIDELIEGLKKLKDQVPSVAYLTAGKNFSPRGDGYQVGLVTRFKNRDDLKVYIEHPAHKALVKDLVAPIKENSVIMDYEIDQ